MSNTIPYGRQFLTEEDIQCVVDVLHGDWLTSGPAVTRFENVVREYLGVKHAIAVSNGTAALHLACLALGVQSGDVGITSALTFLASANCIAYCGGTPDFVDVDPKTYCLSPDGLEEYIQKNGAPKVVIPVDFAGVPADLPRIWALAKKHGFSVIEDAAHSVGSAYLDETIWHKCGACVHSDLAILSFHPVKTVTAGEGGMVLTNDDVLAERVRMFSSHGMQRNLQQFDTWSIDNGTGEVLSSSSSPTEEQEKAPWLYQQQELGFNYRITDIQSALGASQFSRLDDFVHRRREIFDQYQKAFSSCPNLVLPPCLNKTDPAYHLYVLRFKNTSPLKRVEICLRLREEGILAQVHYIPVYLQPWYQRTYGYEAGKCPEAEKIYKNCLSIPLYPSMLDEDINKVIRVISEVSL